jgi:hypothetical protein
MRHKVCPRYAFRHWQSFTLLLCYLGSLALQSEQYSMAYLTKRSDCSLKDTCVPIAPLNYQPLLSQYTPLLGHSFVGDSAQSGFRPLASFPKRLCLLRNVQIDPQYSISPRRIWLLGYQFFHYKI